MDGMVEGLRDAGLGAAGFGAAGFGGRVRRDEPMSRHTTFGIGGPADLLATVRTGHDLRALHRLALQHQVPIVVLGGGSNVLVADAGIRGLVLVNRCRGMVWPGEDGIIEAEAGASLGALARGASERGWQGLEWAVGVPGTLGGAIVGNAGAFGGCMADVVQGVTCLMPDGSERRLTVGELAYDYRTSALKAMAADDGRPIVLAAILRLRRQDPATLLELMRRYSEQRAARQPAGRSAGSMFRRTPQYPAGFLIDQAGLKDCRIGDAVVSSKHANFVLNLGQATACDVLRLMCHVQDVVWQAFGQKLEPEIEFLGDWQGNPECNRSPAALARSPMAELA